MAQTDRRLSAHTFNVRNMDIHIRHSYQRMRNSLIGRWVKAPDGRAGPVISVNLDPRGWTMLTVKYGRPNGRLRIKLEDVEFASP